jgi:hypothetical protein
MTAHGELYINETCRDKFEKQLNKVFGKDKWRLDGSEGSDIWNMTQFPNSIDVNVVDDNDSDKIIGTATIISKSIIEDDGTGEYIDKKPIKIIIRKGEVKQK